MPTLCSTCGGRCGQDSAECIYAGTGAAVQCLPPIKPACVMQTPTQQPESPPIVKDEA